MTIHLFVAEKNFKHAEGRFPVSVKVTLKVYHCVNGDGQIGFGILYVRQCKFDGDCDRNGMCKQA